MLHVRLLATKSTWRVPSTARSRWPMNSRPPRRAVMRGSGTPPNVAVATLHPPHCCCCACGDEVFAPLMMLQPLLEVLYILGLDIAVKVIRVATSRTPRCRHLQPWCRRCAEVGLWRCRLPSQAVE